MPKRKNRVPYHLLTEEGKRLRRKKNCDEFDTLLSPCCDENEVYDPEVPSTSQQEIHLLDSSSSVNGSLDEQIMDENVADRPSDLECTSSESLFDGGVSNISFNDDTGSDVSSEHLGCNDVTRPTLDVTGFLREWAITKNITVSALTELCKGLKKHLPSSCKFLPSDGRTILKTPVSLQVRECPPGQYIHFGLKKQLQLLGSNFQSLPLKYDSLGLLINIDGLPLFNSSPGEFYPILFTLPSVKELSNKVFPVGLYYGERKPENLSIFLNEFIDELKDVINNGIQINDIMVNVYVMGFCCDTPAKSYILGTTSHVGYSSCTRCQIHGETLERRRVFLDNNCKERTHDDFINQIDKKFQPRETPLVEIPGINFVKSFVLDYMHLICLGVLRTLIFLWYSGPIPHRLSKGQRDLMSERLLSLRCFIPNDFVRKPRELHLIKSWKATELRMFLLYLGPVVLKGLLPKEKYNNFLTLHVAVSILLNHERCRNSETLNLAKELLINFVDSVKVFYGEMYISHNFHNLIHIVDDVEHFSPQIQNFTIDSISAFPFENFLQKIKKRVRGRAKPLQQIGKRLEEMFSSGTAMSIPIKKSEQFPKFASRHNDGPLPAFCVGPQYKKLVMNQYELTVNPPDNCCQLKNGIVLLIDNFAYSRELKKMVVVGKKFKKKESYYEVGLKSSEMGILRVGQPSSRKIFPVEKISKNCVLLQLEGKQIVFPLLHCNNES